MGSRIARVWAFRQFLAGSHNLLLCRWFCRELVLIGCVRIRQCTSLWIWGSPVRAREAVPIKSTTCRSTTNGFNARSRNPATKLLRRHGALGLCRRVAQADRSAWPHGDMVAIASIGPRAWRPDEQDARGGYRVGREDGGRWRVDVIARSLLHRGSGRRFAVRRGAGFNEDSAIFMPCSMLAAGCD